MNVKTTKTYNYVTAYDIVGKRLAAPQNNLENSCLLDFCLLCQIVWFNSPIISIKISKKYLILLPYFSERLAVGLKDGKMRQHLNWNPHSWWYFQYSEISIDWQGWACLLQIYALSPIIVQFRRKQGKCPTSRNSTTTVQFYTECNIKDL